jgi:hypothetical protein
MTASAPELAQQLLNAVYHDLEFVEGTLVPTSSEPGRGASADAWRDIGEWLILGDRLGAERVFFVADDPVVLFSELHGDASEEEFVAAYRRAWSLGRARCLFIAKEGELRVYALTEPPPRSLNDQNPLTPLEIVTRAADVADQLADYHRDRVESGLLFEDKPYRAHDGRADQRFLRDVQAATNALVGAGLRRSLAHALIERVILIRYLEDRKVIDSRYFQDVAGERNREANEQFLPESPMPSLGAQSDFITYLSAPELTYAIFEALERDFNGDLFIVSPAETQLVTREHLLLIQRLLSGVGVDGQDPLFLWAYDFSVVPTSLISEMYEQFYSAGTTDDSSTHYTPQELVEYTLSTVLTRKVLDEKPRICDPACGSGIFLVEAFRRLVRYEMAERTARLNSEELSSLLLDRIAGIDINPEAVRLAAFSLYLAYLNYLEPRDITSAGPLPRLVYRTGDPPDKAVLVVADAFSPTILKDKDSGGTVQRGSAVVSDPVRQSVLPWPEGTFGVVVGNPPWDEPRAGKASRADIWAKRNNLPVGDRSPSQLFMWRTLSLLRPGGTSALLVAATAFHNVRHTSREFRRRWLADIELETVVNFAPARWVFFARGVAPFFLVAFRRGSGEGWPTPVLYRTLRPSKALDATRSMAYATSERRWVSKEALRQRDYLWKTYAWGNHLDAALMARLDAEKQLRELLPDDPEPGWGYQYGQKPPSKYLMAIPSLKSFRPWGPLRPADYEDLPRRGVKRQPDERLYRGQRILISRGIRVGFGPAVRLIDTACSFRHTIYCLPMPDFPSWQAKTIFATILSSLGRYRLFMHSGSWGVWHDSVTAEDILSLPIRLTDAEDPAVRQIESAVDQLYEWADLQPPEHILRSIDEAVFDLFELDSAERDLVRDFHTYTLELAGAWSKSVKSEALMPVALPLKRSGTADDIPVGTVPISQYLDRFLRRWNQELEPDGEFSWRVVSSPRSAMTAAIFETRDRNASLPVPNDEDEWHVLLDRLSVSLQTQITPSVITEGVLRSVSDTSIVVVKRNEARLWSATAALEDVEATMLQAMTLQEQ